MATTIAIAGISGRLALLVTKELLKRPDVHVRGSCRNIDKLPNDLKTSSRVSLIQSGPYDTEALRKLIKGSDVVVCCYYADDEVMLEGQKLLIDLCEEEGITRYIASDYTGDYDKLDWADLAIKNPMKYIKAHLDAKATVSGVHILVGIFTEAFFDFFGLWDPKAKTISYWGTGNEKWDLTSYQTGAEYVAAVALDPNATGFLKFRGAHKSALEIADDIEALCGFRPALESRGSLTDLATRLDGAGNTQDILTAATYFMLSGKIALGEHVDNAKYPFVVPEAVSDVLSQLYKK